MRFKLNLLLFLLVTAVLVASSTFSYHELRAELYGRFQENKQALAARLQGNLINTLWNYDQEQASRVVEAEMKSADVSSIEVYQSTGRARVLWVSRNREAAEANALQEQAGVMPEDVILLPLVAAEGNDAPSRAMPQGEELGALKISFTRQRVERVLAELIRNRLFEIIILNLALGALLFVLTSRMVIAPLRLLSHAFKQLAAHPRTGELDIRCEDEFGEIVDAFNQIERRLVSDIDRRVEAEKNLRESNRELTEALASLNLAKDSLVQAEKFASLGALVAGVAHEINTPVGVAVTGASFVLEEARRIEKRIDAGTIRKSEILQFIESIKQGADLVLSNSERAAHLIQSFKQVAADETSEARRRFDLRGYLTEVLTSLGPCYKKTRITVDFECPEGVNMDTYPGLLTQVLSNLVVNALTHGYAEDENGHVRIRALPEEGWITIECSNDGKPIPPEHLTRVFEPFFTTRRSQGGTGLGLHIAFNVVTQRLGGTLKVESEAGSGTRFTIRIPRELGEKTSGGRE